jgi:uncharacterized protein YndB with AHSA1/START domain
MQKTGESYTAARAQVLAKGAAKLVEPGRRATREARAGHAPVAADATTAPSPAVAVEATAASAAPPSPASPVAPEQWPALAGFSDAIIQEKTGCTWAEWVGHLDYWGAAAKPHREIADHVHGKFGVPGWWAQAVTVGYERIRGLREVGQRRDGVYEANKSKTVAVPVERLFAAWTDPAERERWLPGVTLAVRKATPFKWVRITWEDGSNVEVALYPRGEGKSNAGVQHGKLPSRERAAELKAWWGERLDALAAYLKQAE